MASIPEETEVPQPQEDRSKLHQEFRQRIEATKQYRRKLVHTWTTNIDYRRGKPFTSQSDEDRIAVNMDWSLTKDKQANLFSQVPAIRVNHSPQTIADQSLPWVHSFEQRINDTLVSAGIESVMDEVLPDCINAAGIGVAIVAHEAITEDVEVPAVDIEAMPDFLKQQIFMTGMMPDGSPIPMEIVPRVVDHRYTVTRVSPADFLWPISFTGSDFDKSPWIGRSGRMSWASAVNRFRLDPSQRDKFVGEDRQIQDKLTNDVDKDKITVDDEVGFDEIFYLVNEFHPEAKSFSGIWHMIFLHGQDTPVVDEPWKGQDVYEDQLVGSLKYPIRVLTLAYLTDEAIPPSDTAIGRAQVDEINRGRTQVILQRDRSLPVRWIDINRLDPQVQLALMRGTWQGMVPVQGDGSRIIGEVARASMPNEDFTFDITAKQDLMNLWGSGQADSGQQVETKGEAQAIQTNKQTRISRERAKVGKFFCSIAEVTGGLLCLYEPPDSFGQGFNPLVSRTLAYSILADSTILLDSNQRLKKLVDFVNFAAKSGYLEVESVLKEIATLSGLDPAVVIRKPEPKPPAEPNISLRLTGTEDMMNPLTLAMMIKAGQAPTPEHIEQAKQLIINAVTPPPNAIPAPPMPPQMGPDGKPIPPETGGNPVPPPIPIAPPLPVPSPGMPAPPDVGGAHPSWGALDRINKRVVDRSET